MVAGTFKNFEAGESFVIGGDEMPRCVGAVGQREHVADGDLVGAPLSAVAPVLIVNFMAFVGGGFAMAEAAELLLGGEMEPEFEYDDAVVRQLGFEFIEFVVGAPPFRGSAETLDPLDEHATVPGSIVDGDAAGSGHMAPESPQVMVGLFLVGGFGDRDDAIVAGIDGAGEAADGAALAGGIPALENPHDGAALFGGGADGVVEAAQPFIAFGLVGGFGEVLVEG